MFIVEDHTVTYNCKRLRHFVSGGFLLFYFVYSCLIGSHTNLHIFYIYDIFQQVLEDASRRSDDNEIIIFPLLLHPKSIGSIKLKSKDPFDHPLINPNYLSQQDDVDILIEGKNLRACVSMYSNVTISSTHMYLQ